MAVDHFLYPGNDHPRWCVAPIAFEIRKIVVVCDYHFNLLQPFQIINMQPHH